MGDTAQFGRALDGDVVAHGPNEEDQGGERFAAVLEDGAGVPRWAFKVLPIRRAAPVATATHVGGLSEQKELVGDEARHEYPEGVRSSHIELSHLQAHPSGRNRRLTKNWVGAQPDR